MINTIAFIWINLFILCLMVLFIYETTQLSVPELILKICCYFAFISFIIFTIALIVFAEIKLLT